MSAGLGGVALPRGLAGRTAPLGHEHEEGAPVRLYARERCCLWCKRDWLARPNIGRLDCCIVQAKFGESNGDVLGLGEEIDDEKRLAMGWR